MMQTISSFQEACDYLSNFIRPVDYKRVPSKAIQTNPLKRMEYFLSLLGNPHNTFPSVVVSGTSGKGSTTHLVSNILTTCGYKTGMTISPHLIDIRERLQINGKSISQEQFIVELNKLLPHIEKVSQSEFGEPSYFEILLAMTFNYFSHEHVDIAVVEVGLEGKFDGTNVLRALVFILTNISLDHTQILGNTVEEIALEATARIENLQVSKDTRAITVTGVTQSSVLNIVKEKTKQSSVILKQLHKDFHFKMRREDQKGLEFDFIDNSEHLPKIFMRLIGAFQIENACLAIEACIQLRNFGFSVSNTNIRKALSQVIIPGRFQSAAISDHLIIYDGAHNPAKMNAFINSFRHLYKHQKSIFIVAFTQGHGIEKMLNEIAGVADVIILTEYAAFTDMGKQRMVSTQTLVHYLRNIVLFDKTNIYIQNDFKQSLQMAINLANEKEEIIVITGSLYLIGNLMELLLAEHL